jgi:methyl coenzyme M reductase beta subunit
MLSIIKASSPQLYKAAAQYAYCDKQEEVATTHLTKKAFVITKAEASRDLVDQACKLGSAVLTSLKASSDEDKLKKKMYKAKKKTAGVSIPKALGLGAVATIPAALTANYMVDKASDELDSKMYAIPGLAAATIGAILAAKNMSGKNVSPEDMLASKELHSALEAKDAIDSVLKNSDVKTASETYKLAALNTEHVSVLISSILS